MKIISLYHDKISYFSLLKNVNNFNNQVSKTYFNPILFQQQLKTYHKHPLT